MTAVEREGSGMRNLSPSPTTPGISGSVLSFDRLGPMQETCAGGKGAMLARLRRAGYPVPDGFIILTSAFAGDDLEPEAWRRVREQMVRLRGGDASVECAVRSSAPTEDSTKASFAGQFETVLGVNEDERLREAILTVRRSRRSRRVRAYSRAKGVAPDHEMAVVVQRLVPAEISGVLFTADPLTGSRVEMKGSFVRGFGDRLVAGQASGESFSIARPRATYAGPDDLRRQARALYRLGNRLERELGGPQDVEWVIADGRLFLLQARAITTLVSHDPATGEWNDSRTGDHLWSNVNFGEAVPGVMTPLTWTVIRLVLKDWNLLPGFENCGNISGRPYLNLSVLAEVFRAMGRSDRDLLETLEPTVYTKLPATMPIPPLELSRWSVLRHFPRWARAEILQRRGVRALPGYVADNPAWCRQTSASLASTETGAGLWALWHDEILPHVVDGVWIVLGSVAHFARSAAPLRRELVGLVGPEAADALLSGPQSDGAGLLANLGPLVGIARLARGELGRREYLDLYGHRGAHEFELSAPRPFEEPDWVDRQVDRFRSSPPGVEDLLLRRRARFDAAWESLRSSHRRKARSLRRRVEEASKRSRMREAARSEYVRDRWIVRAFALRAGALLGLGDDVFFLTIDELLAALKGAQTASGTVAARRETHRRLSSLPPYPSVIRGRFDPYGWAADPRRRSDIFDAHAAVAPAASRGAGSSVLSGAPGSAGRVEGVVRRLDSPAEAEGLRRGEILVTSQTDIEWTLVFPLAAAIVTDVGAPLSHAAIVARELGIPAVVGCGDATMRLRTGDRVAVDGGRGLVQLLDAGPSPDPDPHHPVPQRQD